MNLYTIKDLIIKYGWLLILITLSHLKLIAHEKNSEIIIWEKIKGNKEEIQNKPIAWDEIKIDTERRENKLLWEKINYSQEVIYKQKLKFKKTSDKLKTKKKNYNTFSSISRNIVYKENIYPEMSFWIPSSFKQNSDYKFTFKTQVLGNPTNRLSRDSCSFNEYWSKCADSQYLIEYTPIIKENYSLGINYSQQESFIGNRADSGWNNAGQAIGFQIKGNIKENQAFSFSGNNLYNPYGKGGPNSRHPRESEVIEADLGRSYLFLYSSAFDIGRLGKSKTEAIINLNIGFGNGRYKTAKEIEKDWINLGKYNTIYSLGFALNQRITFFIEHAGQYAGIGSSIKPIEAPLTATIMLRDFKGSNQGIINCKDGNTNNCRTAIDARLVYKF